MTVKESVLQALEQSKGKYISGEELSDKLSVSRAAVWKGIKALREEGYVIDAVTNKGYMMPENPDTLSKEAIIKELPSKLKTNEVIVLDVTDSTNLQAKQLVMTAKAKHGTAIVANQQTGGRGRLGRSFFSPKNGLYLSIIIRPQFNLNRSTLVTVAAAAAVADSIDAAMAEAGKSTPAEIKWVNDIYLEGKKVCGILTEATTDFESGQIDSLIIGIGINTSTEGFPKELMDIAGAVEGDYSKSALAAHIIENVLKNIGQIEALDKSESKVPPKFVETYKAKSLVSGKTIKVYKGTYRKDPSKELGGLTAKVLGIDDNGGLEVIYTDGTRETLTSGEISIRL